MVSRGIEITPENKAEPDKIPPVDDNADIESKYRRRSSNDISIIELRSNANPTPEIEEKEIDHQIQAPALELQAPSLPGQILVDAGEHIQNIQG